MNEYIKLDRHFRDLTNQERESPELIALLYDNEPCLDSSWDKLLKSERVLILAEAGSGKTIEMKAQKKRLTAEGHFAFFIPIEMLYAEDIRSYLSFLEQDELENFETWLADSNNRQAYFFLDAVDELKLAGGKLEISLGKVARALGKASRRAHIFVSCRPTDWSVEDMTIFQEKFPVSEPLSMPEPTGDEVFLASLRSQQLEERKKREQPVEKFRCVILQSLSKNQIEIFARAEGIIDPKAFLTEISKRHAWAFVKRPLDLKRIIAVWKVNGKLDSLRQQHETDIAASLSDKPDRPDPLSMDRAIEGAERLALAMVLTKKWTIQAPGQPHEMVTSSLDASTILTDWNFNEIKALLRRSIFDPATYGRVRFHHRSIQEFLAARRLQKLHIKGLSKRQLLSLIFANTYGENIVIPSMRSIAAWLSKDNDNICRKILQAEPEVLMLYGDPETLPLSTRTELVRSYVATYANGKWRGLNMPIAEVQRLASPDLSVEIKHCWSQSLINEEVRIFLLKLIWLGEIQDCAEIAFEAVINTDLEDYARIVSARALGKCKRYDLLRKIYDDILAYPGRWPDRFIYSSADEFFPNVISATELKQLIQRTHTSKQSVGGFSWALYNLAKSLEPNSDAAVPLRDILYDLIWESRQPTERWENPVSEYSYLTPALARLCRQKLSTSLPSQVDEKWIDACVIASRFHNDNTLAREDLDQLTQIFEKQSLYREAVFWSEVKARDIVHPDNNNLDQHLFYVQEHSLFHRIVADDWNWLLQAIRKTNSLRRCNIALHLLISLWHQRGRLDTDLKILKNTTKGNQDLTKMLIDKTAVRSPAPMLLEWQKEDQAISKKQADKQQNFEQSWSAWKAEIEANPKAHFKKECRAGTRDRFFWWLSISHKENMMLAYRNWTQVRQIFGNVIGELFEQDLKNYWKKTKPPIWSKRLPEDYNKIYGTQYIAFTGLAIEAASNSAWASTLPWTYAKRAAEWGLTELNKIPEWYTALVKEQPKAVQSVLVAELKSELKDILISPNSHVLNLIQYGDHELKSLAFPYLKTILIKWPHLPKEQNKEAIYNQNLGRVLSIVIAAAPNDSDIMQLCEERFLCTLDHPSAIIWLRGLFFGNPKQGIETLDKGIHTLSKLNRTTQAIEWFAQLFGDYDHFDKQIDTHTNVELLASLTKLAYKCVRYEDDVQHEGIYTPDTRDKAERARNRLIELLIEKPGFETHEVLTMLADDPLFTHVSDKLRLVARERAAKDSELPIWSPTDYRQWEERYEIQPRNCGELLQVALDCLDDIQHDIHHHDFSDRQILAEKIKHEKEMQVLLAKKLSDAAHGRYIVSREEEVVDKKEPDIRLSTPTARCAIEVKMGDNWSVAELEDAIKNQLVGQYLRHSNCTAGCLLITYAGDKGFNDPNTGKAIRFEDVIEQLRRYAATLEKAENGRIRLAIFPLDLRKSNLTK